MLLDPTALLFTNLIAGLAIIGILWLSQIDVGGSKQALHLWIAADLCFSLGRTTLLLQPGVLFPEGVTALTAPVAFNVNATAVIAGVALHALALASLTSPQRRGGRSLLLGLAIAAAYAAVSLLLMDAWTHRLQLMLTVIIGVTAWSIFLASKLPRSVGSRIIIAAHAVVIALDGGILLRVFLGTSPGPVVQAGSPSIPPLPALVIDLLAPLIITMGFVLLLQSRLRAHIERLSNTDALTNALNRRGGMRALERELRRVTRHDGEMSLAIFDLDHFKRINDTLGHGVGDDVLAGFAQRVQGMLRATDKLVRWGGEEFLLLMPATSLEAASQVADRVRVAVGSTSLAEGAPLVTVSVGVSSWSTTTSRSTLAQLLTHADEHLYRAKLSRNCVVTASTATA